MKRIRRSFHLLLHDMLVKDPEHFAPHGIRIHIPRSADQSIRYLLARNRPYEQPEWDLIRRHLRTGMNVLELGGCMGIVSASIRAAIGPSARHIVVEAIPELAKICATNARIGAAPDAITLVEAAIDYSGSPTVRFAPRHNAHVGGVAGPNEAGVDVPATTLAALAKQMPTGPFALVCDIEGTELDMFAHESVVLDRIDVLILETHPKRYAHAKTDIETLHRRLRDHGLHLVDSSSDVQCFLRRP
ncbi:MAG: FkbM family methyltransferase [Phycisphaerae bacterium]|nr:FkbM family methyltransferase [Phycisphaerae bacterium]